MATIILALLPLAGPGRQPRERRFEFTALLMGVKARIVLYSTEEEAARDAAAAAFARIGELDAMMSDYRPDSELTLLSERAAGREATVSPELALILARSQELAAATDGAFDVTAGPMTALWRLCRDQRRLPTEAELADARARVGWRLLEVNEGARTVRLAREGMRLDLGGIAKGFAAQEALRVVRARGISRALVGLGGDLALGDPPPGRAGWSVGISSGLEPERSVLLANMAISTSGDAEQHIEIDGRRYGHIVDARTGLGSTRRAAATVIAGDGATADALGTCLSLIGLDGALLARYPGAEARVVEMGPDGRGLPGEPVIAATSGFPELKAAGAETQAPAAKLPEPPRPSGR
jgi:thiamine biosynthesis lipoprotein